MVAFRDPYGIRPLCYGEADLPDGREVMVASESVALEGTGHRFVRDVAPGEALFIDLDGQVHAQQCADAPCCIPACSSTCTWRGPIR
jgi:amidophosphoribosyltransferase